MGTPNPASLEPYRRTLPANEFAALEAWLSTFWDFQLEWLLEPAASAACNKSRQIGVSHTTSGVGVIWGAFHGELTTIISVGQLESAEVLDKAKKHADILVRLGSRMAVRGARDNATELSFASGGRILALPSTGGRSFAGHVFLDEYGYQDHAADVWDAAAAVTLLGYRLRVVSTPNGIGNEFHRLWDGIRAGKIKGWKAHEIPIKRAIAEGYPVDLERCWSLAKGDPRLFAQLFECSFLDGNLQYISTELVSAAEADDLYTYEGDYFAGLDIGRTVDRTVLVVLRKRPDDIRVIAWIAVCKRTDSDQLEALVDWAFQVFKLKKLSVDATGMGAFPAERMQKRHGKFHVDPVNFTGPSKEELATTLYSSFSERTLKIPRTDAALRLPHGLSPQLIQSAAPFIQPKAAEQLRADVCSIRREITAAGNVRYDAPRTDEGHADSAWALALALHACGRAPGKKGEIVPGAGLPPVQGLAMSRA